MNALFIFIDLCVEKNEMEFYKIYFEHKKVVIADEADLAFKGENVLYAAYDNESILKDLVHVLLTVPSLQTLFVFGPKPDIIWKAFQSYYTLLDAAGGLVTNKAGHALLIFRKGKWDLPKGKIEVNESISNAALREVIEECGVKDLNITAELCKTYHIYTLHGKEILKVSHWFAMRSNDSETSLVPQTEEGITEARWMSANEALTILNNSYSSVRDVLTRFFIKSL
jgi:8-oxo-dGTP pyrophosphatase MutT (NUDIX family)